MHVAAETSEDRESATEVMLASRERVLQQLNAMNEDLAAMVQRLDDSDWPPPLSESVDLPVPSSEPSNPPPSERH